MPIMTIMTIIMTIIITIMTLIMSKKLTMRIKSCSLTLGQSSSPPNGGVMGI